ncbi:hypothetical protein VNO80_24590 [Phaseolus coccineus]|uniref:Uncharacterized protein n=1 Tax=Phaseolus coccineus TaxID=3886 RepID=A0AAN9LWY5_PHACN
MNSSICSSNLSFYPFFSYSLYSKNKHHNTDVDEYEEITIIHIKLQHREMRICLPDVKLGPDWPSSGGLVNLVKGSNTSWVSRRMVEYGISIGGRCTSHW